MVKYLALIFVLTSAFTMKSDSLIKNMYPFLIGEYQLVQVVDGKKVKLAKEMNAIYSLKVQKNDRLVVFKDGKKTGKYKFVETSMSFLQDQNHIVIAVKDEFQPVFYRTDTVILNNYPEEFLDNYFVKIKK
ncbi:MAG: hypothetical protein ACK46Y_17525 [Fluviicola sp.]|jgi:hypothetical protein